MPDSPTPNERGFATGLGAVVVGVLATLAAIFFAGFLALSLDNLRGAVLILAGAVLFVLFALVYVTLALQDAQAALASAGIAVRRRGATRTATTFTTAPIAERSGPFGLVYPVLEVEGIGPARAIKLKAQGIETTKDLWFADAAQVASKLKVGTPMVRQWQQMSELMAIGGLGKQYSEVLVKAGVTTIEDLAAADPADLVVRAQKAGEDLTHRIQKNTITEKVTANWIQLARDHVPGDERYLSGEAPWSKPAA